MSEYGEPLFAWVGVTDTLVFDDSNSGDDANNTPICRVSHNDWAYGRATEIAERIVACVNACSDMDDELVRGIDPKRLTEFCKAVGTMNPAGIPFLVQEVEKVVAAMRASLGEYHDPTNILPTLETALRMVKPLA